jgi:hypothetical protein
MDPRTLVYGEEEISKSLHYYIVSKVGIMANLAFFLLCNIATIFCIFLSLFLIILQDLQVRIKKFLPLHYPKGKRFCRVDMSRK